MRVLPVGDGALLVEVSSGDETRALHAELLRRRAEGLLMVREIVPAARTVLLDGLDDPVGLASELTSAEVPVAARSEQDAVDIPVRYDGPDLADVAAHWGVREEDVARIHAATEFSVAFCGFAPASATSPVFRRGTTSRAGPPLVRRSRRGRWHWRVRTRVCTRVRRRADGS